MRTEQINWGSCKFFWKALRMSDFSEQILRSIKMDVSNDMTTEKKGALNVSRRSLQAFSVWVPVKKETGR